MSDSDSDDSLPSSPLYRHSEPADIVIYSRWLIPVVPENQFLDHHAVVVRDGKIVDVLPNFMAKRVYNASKEVVLDEHYVLIPGLINMHTHTPMSLLRGLADDVGLMDWLVHYMWPAEGKFASPEFVRDGSSFSIAEMLRCGVTCFNDMYYFPDVIAEVADECGVRAVVGAPVLQFPSAWAASPDEYFAKAMELHARYKSHPRVSIALAPHAPYTVDDDSFRRAQQLSSEHDMLVHTHVHETEKEIADHVVHPSHGGARPIERLHKLGLVNRRLIAAHMTQLNDDEIDLFAAQGANVVHCPESNMKLGSGVCPVRRLVDARVNVTLGTDGPASNDDVDLLGELRTASLLDKLFAKGRDPLPSYRWLSMATINAARALGLEARIGSLEVGKEADMVAVRLHSEPVYNPITNLSYVGTNCVEYTWVQGKCLYERGQLTTMSLDAVEKRASEWGSKISAWHREHKTADLAALSTAFAELAGVSESTDAATLHRHLTTLNGLKQALHHWSFFAGRGESGTSASELEALRVETDGRLRRLGELHERATLRSVVSS